MIAIQGSPHEETDELDKSLDEFLQKRKEAGQEVKTAAEAESMMSAMLGRLLSRMLEGEMNDRLDCRRGEAKVGDNERNGHAAKRLKTGTIGKVKVVMPMSRGILHIARTHRVVPLWRPSFRRGRNHSETGRCWSHRAAQRELNNEEIFNCQQHGEEGNPIVDRNLAFPRVLARE